MCVCSSHTAERSGKHRTHGRGFAAAEKSTSGACNYFLMCREQKRVLTLSLDFCPSSSRRFEAAGQLTIGAFLQPGAAAAPAEELFSLGELRLRQHFSPPPPSFLLFLLPRLPSLPLQPRHPVTLDPWPALTASYLDPLVTVTSAE